MGGTGDLSLTPSLAYRETFSYFASRLSTNPKYIADAVGNYSLVFSNILSI